jgi:hypothetical protein
MKPMEHSAFPSDETLAAFIDGQLDEETRKRVVAHVADCEDCYGTLEAAGAWQRERVAPDASSVTVIRRRNWSMIGGLAAAAAIGAVVLYQPLSVSYDRHRDVAALRDAANEMPYRVTDARLSLDLPFKKKAPTMRSAAEESESDNLTLLAAASQVKEDVRASKLGQHELGVALLLTGHREDAAKRLGDAVVAETKTADLTTAIVSCTDVDLLNDLSAAHGAVTDFSPNEASTRISLLAAKRAWDLDHSPITAWNRAVAIERVDRKQAAAAWRDYLAIDPNSPWSAAAKDHLANPPENF